MGELVSEKTGNKHTRSRTGTSLGSNRVNGPPSPNTTTPTPTHPHTHTHTPAHPHETDHPDGDHKGDEDHANDDEEVERQDGGADRGKTVLVQLLDLAHQRVGERQSTSPVACAAGAGVAKVVVREMEREDRWGNRPRIN